ncbi:MAG: LTA synthase family protein [Tissierellaceae bacterium]|nr:LTA synthase family protein [Tissierellaceae bacterium]
MIITSILIALKITLFIRATAIQYNPVLIFFISSSISLFITSLIGMSKFKYKNVILSIFYILISAIMLVDAVYYSYFNALPSVKMLDQAAQLSDVSDSVKSLLTLRNLLFVIDLPFVVFYLLKFDKTDSNYSKKLRIGIPSGLLILAIGLFVYSNTTGIINSIKLQELYSFHFTDIKNTLTEDDTKQTLEGNARFTQEDLTELKERTKSLQGPYTGIGKGKNLIVLQIEALQSFVIDLEYNGQEITPNINKLIHDTSSLYYDKYYQLLGRGNTSDAEFVSNNSLHPSMESPTYTQYETNTFYGLPWVLRDNGYTSWAFHGYKKEFWNREKAYVNQGFQRFISEEDFAFEESIGLGITDKDFFDQSIDYLLELDNSDENPFYAFIVSLTSHNPFEMPEEYHVLDIKPEHEGTILGNFLQSIHYTDKYVGEFIEELKEAGLYDDTVIALYGDHFAIQNTSEEVHLLMEEFLGHKYNFNDIMNVPLVIHVPGEELGHTISKVGSQLDFFPTVLNIMGYENEKGLVFGRDLTNYEGYTNVTPQTIMRKGSFIDEDVIFGISRTEIFDHSTASDINTGEPLDVYQFRDIYERAIDDINRSDFILKNDILKHLIENNGELDFGQIQVDSIQNKEYIQKLNHNTIEELTKAYNDGNKIMALDVSFIDGETIEEQKIILSNEESTPIEELSDWSNLYTDTHILLRSDAENKDKLFYKMKYAIPKSQKDFIVEINSFNEHYFITAHGYENLLLNVKGNDYTDKEILDFLKVHSLFGIILEEDMLDTDLVEKIKELGTDVYVEYEDSIEVVQDS